MYFIVLEGESVPISKIGCSDIVALPILVIVDGVHKMLINLKPNKTSGPDGISPHLLKELAIYSLH